MSDRLKCPSCSMPTIEDREGVTEEEMLCDRCYEEAPALTKGE